MLKFRTQPNREIPPSTQLVNQISFAIACGQYTPGYRLPSTRQLAMQTGLHRNTISKVYRQLEEMGLVETRASSGIYVSSSSQVLTSANASPQLLQQREAYLLVKQGLDRLLTAGCSLTQAQDLFLAEIEWRLRCSAQVLVSVPAQDLGSGQLMLLELQQSLGISIQLVPLEELEPVLHQTQSATIVTIRYFVSQIGAIAQRYAMRVLPVDIYDYSREIELIKTLPTDTCLGLVSMSTAILKVANVLVQSMRGEDLLVLTAPVADLEQLRLLVRRAQTIISDPPSYPTVKAVLREARPELIRCPEIICSGNYVSRQSIDLLGRELGLA
jgi:GntR family transcriptional regulator